MFDLFSDPVKVANQMQIIYSEYGFAIWETLYSLALEVLFAYVIGLPLGVLLVTGEREGVKPLPKPVMTVMNVVINLLRSVPFLILMIICLPLSKVTVNWRLVSSSCGSWKPERSRAPWQPVRVSSRAATSSRASILFFIPWCLLLPHRP